MTADQCAVMLNDAKTKDDWTMEFGLIAANNCVGWVTYSILLKNYYVYFANAPGFLVSVWINLCAAKLQYQSHAAREMRESFVQLLQENNQQASFIENGNGTATFGENDNDITAQSHSEEEEETTVVQRAVDAGKIVVQVTSLQTPAPAPHEKLVVGIVIVWTAVISFISLASFLSGTQREYVIGFTVNFNLLFFYGAPLSTIFQVLKSKNSASIHLPTMLTNTANATFWTAYAIAILDPFIFVPNGIGVCLSVVQFILYLILPRNLSEETTCPEEEEEREQALSQDDHSSDQQQETMSQECKEMCPGPSSAEMSLSKCDP